MAEWLNAWVEIDMTSYANGALLDFFNLVEGSVGWNALSRPKQLIHKAVHQANPELNIRGGIRMYESKITPKKYLIYVHVPKLTADEIAALPQIITDNIRFITKNLNNLPTDEQNEYFGEVIDLESSNNYPYFNVFVGVEP